MKDQTREEPKILAAAERQMHAWALTEEIEGRALRAEGPHRLAERLGPYVAISREEGAGGSQIAQEVGRELGWEVLDKSLLDRVAGRYGLSRSMLELVDETQNSWAYDLLGSWMDRRIISHDKYMAHLSRVVLAAAGRGNVVLVGRGAQFLLPREKGLAVRIIAPRKYRIQQIMQRERLSQSAARRLMDARDRGRSEFARRYFHQDIADPHLYDLVVNVERLGPAAAVKQIVAAISR
jgi:cytidylate kinase